MVTRGVSSASHSFSECGFKTHFPCSPAVMVVSVVWKVAWVVAPSRFACLSAWVIGEVCRKESTLQQEGQREPSGQRVPNFEHAMESGGSAELDRRALYRGPCEWIRRSCAVSGFLCGDPTQFWLQRVSRHTLSQGFLIAESPIAGCTRRRVVKCCSPRSALTLAKIETSRSV